MPADTPTVAPPMTDRQHEVLRMIAESKTNEDIGAALFLSPHTVKTHLRRLYSKWGVSGRLELVRAATDAGLLSCAGCSRTAGDSATLHDLIAETNRLPALIAARLDSGEQVDRG